MTVPQKVRVVEVGPRDGFQMEDRFIPTELKVDTIQTLASAGVQEIEAVSFVHPKVIPQMADAAEVMRQVERHPGVRYTALVPNLKGTERALEVAVDAVRLVVCATETYNSRNVGLSIEESLEVFGQIARLTGDSGVPAAAVIGVALGCPFEGEVPEEKVLDLARRLVDLGSGAIGIADSAGLSNPRAVRALVRKLGEALPDVPLWLHLHDTRGMGLANALVALEEGVDTFDTSLGGLGGCPIMSGATGNIATEDFVNMCEELGAETGIDLGKVRRASRGMEAFLGRSLPSRVLSGGTRQELYEKNRAVGG
jgi:hydroxymethylglutaryl-CoA lyase